MKTHIVVSYNSIIYSRHDEKESKKKKRKLFIEMKVLLSESIRKKNGV